MNEKEAGVYDCVKHSETGFLYEDNIFAEFDSVPQSLRIESNVYYHAFWYKVVKIQEVFEILLMIPDYETYMFVNGNTAQGGLIILCIA